MEEFKEPENFQIKHSNKKLKEVQRDQYNQSPRTPLLNELHGAPNQPKRTIHSAPVKPIRENNQAVEITPLKDLKRPPNSAKPLKRNDQQGKEVPKDTNSLIHSIAQKLLFHSSDKVVHPIVEPKFKDMSEIKFPRYTGTWIS